ncbi:MAG: DUF402 domain-containing protein [Lachnospiraceae bacterium]|nr:DUF402 domain-containing protein [Lachnospiraceae bacterium]
MKLYRRRYFPDEEVLLKDDTILFHDNHLIITKWDTLKARADIKRGYSAYFLKEGFKISKMLGHDEKLVYWYCDIIDTAYDAEDDAFHFTDLLVDVLVYPDGTSIVMDLDELADMLDKKIISPEETSKALRTANELLVLIRKGDFIAMQKVLEKYIDD